MDESNMYQKNLSNQIVLIDMFKVPKESKEEFLSVTKGIQSFLKNLPGFIEGYLYEKSAGEGMINIVTTAVWSDAQAFESAKKAMPQEFQRRNLNPQEIMKKLNVTVERGVFVREPY